MVFHAAREWLRKSWDTGLHWLSEGTAYSYRGEGRKGQDDCIARQGDRTDKLLWWIRNRRE